MLGLFDKPYTLECFSIAFQSFKSDGPRSQWSSIVDFEINVGSWVFKENMDDYCNNLHTIRHSLERYVLEGKTEIIFYSDMEPIVISITKKTGLGSAKYEKQPWIDRYEDVDEIIITPSSWTKMEPYTCYCRANECVTKIYMALLNYARIGCLQEISNQDDIIWPLPLQFYNIVKSPLLESILQNKRYDEGSNLKRQTVITQIYTISPDAAGSLYHDAEGRYDGPNNGLVSFTDGCDTEVCRFEFKELEEWYNEFIQSVNWVDSCLYADFDVENWHTRGIELAKTIREKLPNEIDLWYDIPFEDVKNRNKAAVLIMKDYGSYK